MKFRKYIPIYIILIMLSKTGIAAMTWLGPAIDLTPPGTPYGVIPQVAISKDGANATAVWNTEGSGMSSSATISGNKAVWGYPIDISTNQEANQSSIKIALSNDGTKATAVWIAPDGANWKIQSASATISDRTAAWGSVDNIYSGFEGAIDSLQLVLSDDGTMATVLWQGRGIKSTSAKIKDKNAIWGKVTTLPSNVPDALYPKISGSSDGGKVVVVWHGIYWGRSIIESSVGYISGNETLWTNPIAVSELQNSVSLPEVKISRDGLKATAVWIAYKSNSAVIQSSSAEISNIGPQWGSVVDAYKPQYQSNFLRLSLSGKGDKAIVIWQEYNGNYTSIKSLAGTVGDNSTIWGDEKPVSISGQDTYGDQALVALSLDGSKATALWLAYNGENWIIQSSSVIVKENTMKWSSVVDISARGGDSYFPQLALSDDGNQATAVWNQRGDTLVVQTASAMNIESGAQSEETNDIPTVPEWAQILMMLMMTVTLGWYSRKMTR